MRILKEADMEVLHDEVKSVFGYFFITCDNTIIANDHGNIHFMVYPKDGSNKEDNKKLQKLIRLLALSYRMVLIDDGYKENVGFLLYGEIDESEDLEATMDWIALSHPKWVVVDCQKETNTPTIIGYRIANNLFHAKKLMLHGELLE